MNTWEIKLNRQQLHWVRDIVTAYDAVDWVKDSVTNKQFIENTELKIQITTTYEYDVYEIITW